jgi:hypothetical protein
MNRLLLLFLITLSLNALADNDCENQSSDSNCKNEISILKDIKPSGLEIVETTISSKGLIVATVKTSDKKILSNFIEAVKNNKTFKTVNLLDLGEAAGSDKYFLYIGISTPSSTCHPYTKPSVATLSC